MILYVIASVHRNLGLDVNFELRNVIFVENSGIEVYRLSELPRNPALNLNSVQRDHCRDFRIAREFEPRSAARDDQLCGKFRN